MVQLIPIEKEKPISVSSESNNIVRSLQKKGKKESFKQNNGGGGEWQNKKLKENKKAGLKFIKFWCNLPSIMKSFKQTCQNRYTCTWYLKMSNLGKLHEHEYENINCSVIP